MQFRYQVVGIVMGAVLCVAFARLFMTAYPVLRIDTFAHPEARAARWQSAMTFKFVGALRGLGHLPAHQVTRARHRASHRPRHPDRAQGRSRARRAGRAFVASARRGLRRRLGGRRGRCCRAPTRRRSAASSICRRRPGWRPGGVVASVLATSRSGQPAARPDAGGRRRAARGHEHELAARRRPHRGRVAVRAGDRRGQLDWPDVMPR